MRAANESYALKMNIIVVLCASYAEEFQKGEFGLTIYISSEKFSTGLSSMIIKIEHSENRIITHLSCLNMSLGL